MKKESTKPYRGKLSNRSIQNYASLFDETKGYIEAGDKFWPRCICFDIGPPEEDISLAYASDKDTLSMDEVTYVREVLTALVDMDSASGTWADSESVQDYKPWLGMVTIEDKTVSLHYSSQSVNSTWEVEFEFDSISTWRRSV